MSTPRIQEVKNKIRASIRNKRKQFDYLQREIETDAILRFIINHKPYLREPDAKPRTLLFYMPMPEEVNIVPVIEHALRKGDRILLPRVTSQVRSMDLHRIKSLSDVEETRTGWFEPKKTMEKWTLSEGVDGIVIPGLAFDRQGGRIGYGGGYYDTLLQQLNAMQIKPWTLAPAFWFQIVDDIPREPHDQRINYLATSRGILTCLPE